LTNFTDITDNWLFRQKVKAHSDAVRNLPAILHFIYWYGTNSAPLMETDLSNNEKTTYYFLNGERIARVQPSNQLEIYFNDHLGNARAVYSYPNMILTDFYPFGGERDLATVGTPNAYKFTGNERDSESGLDNFGARYHSSSMGRFMSPDSPAFAHLSQPQAWNLYAYTDNNPTSLLDPDGHDVACGNNPGQLVTDANKATKGGGRVYCQTTTHSFLWWHSTTSKLAIKGDEGSFRALAGC
jgi:RHS repeat-associated protein